MGFKKGENSRKLREASQALSQGEQEPVSNEQEDVIDTEYLPSAEKEVVTSEMSVGKSKLSKVYVWDTNVGFGRDGRNIFAKRGDVVQDLTPEEFEAFLVKKSIKEKI